MDSSKNQTAPENIEAQGNINRHHPNFNRMDFTFSADEIKILRECKKESFYQRSLPFSVGFGLFTYLSIKRGFLKPNAKYGAAPKVVFSSILGYLIGKFSYQWKCAEKIMQLPNSRLAEAFKRRKNGDFFESIYPDGGLSLAPFFSASNIYTDENFEHSSQSDIEGSVVSS